MSIPDELTLPDVARVKEPYGSHIEPPLDQTWNQDTKLAWHAAVVAHDGEIRISVIAHREVHGYAIAAGTGGYLGSVRLPDRVAVPDRCRSRCASCEHETVDTGVIARAIIISTHHRDFGG